MNHAADSRSDRHETKTGALYAVLAYTAWGIVPIYWKLFGSVSALEILSHRVLWSTVFLAGLLMIQKRGAELRHIATSPRMMFGLLLTTILISCNWGLFIYSMTIDRVVEASLGYYINPLMNVLLGAIFLKERLQLEQKIAVLLASAGVAYFVLQFGQLPWIALTLATSFSLYGLLRKLIAVTPLVGLTIETALATPIALSFVLYLSAQGTSHFATNPLITLLFLGCGLVTSFPLLWFNNAAKRLRLTTLGFFQYIGPTLQLLLGVFLYQESFTLVHSMTFASIWLAIVLYSIASLKSQAKLSS